MAHGLRGRAGGIRSLLELIRQHREAIEYDLIGLGLRLDDLGTRRLSWRDLWVIVREAPNRSALVRAIDPESAAWSHTDYLLALVFDAVQIGNWHRAGSPAGYRPEPLERPGVERPNKKYGSEAVGMAEMDKFLGWDKEASA